MHRVVADASVGKAGNAVRESRGGAWRGRRGDRYDASVSARTGELGRMRRLSKEFAGVRRRGDSDGDGGGDKRRVQKTRMCHVRVGEARRGSQERQSSVSSL